MTDKIDKILLYSSESHSIDFKRIQYPIEKHAKKYELLKDVMAMTNHPSNEDKYIFIGVKEKNGMASEFFNIDKLVDDAKYQQLILNSIEPKINFEYKPFDFQGKRLAYFRIFNNQNRPYLVKKDIFSAIDPKKNEYRKGDGYIRVGTSTEKMGRSELDLIYEDRLAIKDRKSDLIIIPYLGIPSYPNLEYGRLRYLDLQIENKSNKSIDLDVEMKILKKEQFTLISQSDFLNEIERKRSEKSSTYNLGSVISNFHLQSLHTSIDDQEEFLIISCTKLRNQKNALTLQQKEIDKEVFGQDLYVLIYETTTISVEITIRSDDFTEGILTKLVEIDVE